MCIWNYLDRFNNPIPLINTRHLLNGPKYLQIPYLFPCFLGMFDIQGETIIYESKDSPPNRVTYPRSTPRRSRAAHDDAGADD